MHVLDTLYKLPKLLHLHQIHWHEPSHHPFVIYAVSGALLLLLTDCTRKQSNGQTQWQAPELHKYQTSAPASGTSDNCIDDDSPSCL